MIDNSLLEIGVIFAITESSANMPLKRSKCRTRTPGCMQKSMSPAYILLVSFLIEAAIKALPNRIVNAARLNVTHLENYMPVWEVKSF